MNPTLPELSDVAAQVKSGTVDTATGVYHQALAADEFSTPPNFTRLTSQTHNFMQLLGNCIQGMVFDLDNGLAVGVFALRYMIGASEHAFAGTATTAMPASKTTHVYLDSDATLKTEDAAWPSGDHFKLAIVTTDATEVTDVTDERFKNFPVGVVSNWFAIVPTANVDMNAKALKNLGMLSLTNWVELTVATGAITPTQTCHKVDTESDAASDDLTTITATSGDEWRRILILRAENAARVVTIKSTGNITLTGGDFALNDANRMIMLVQDSDTTWLELTRNVDALNLASTELTIASGIVTRTGTGHTIDTESDAGSDSLATISGGSDGDVLLISAEHTDRTVIVKHGTGNILLATGADYSMDDLTKRLLLVYVAAAGKWYEVARSYHSLVDLVGTGNAIPYPRDVHVNGTPTVKEYTEFTLFCPVAFTIKDAHGEVGTAPTGGACIVDVLVNGASIFASQAEMINIADGSNSDTSATKNHAVSAGDIITIEVEAVNTAADLSVHINGYIAPQTPPS